VRSISRIFRSSALFRMCSSINGSLFHGGCDGRFRSRWRCIPRRRGVSLP
jgi:hypothetical protein